MSEADGEKNKKGGLGSTALRIASALPLIPFVLWLLFSAPTWGFQLWGLLWMAICADELMRMVAPGSRVSRIYGVIGTVAVSAVLMFFEEPALLMACFIGVLVGALGIALCTPEPVERAGERIAWYVAGPVYIGGTLSCLAKIHAFEHGGAWVLLAMFVAFLSDTGAYFVGRFFGRHKLYPSLSPKKTIEGSLGGLATATLGVLVLQQTLLFEVLPLIDALGLGIIAGALGQAGDLLESLLKRSYGVKDSGAIMPGHGGLLDRSDALMFTGATTWIYVAWILPLR